MEGKRISWVYRTVKALVRFFYPKITVCGTQWLPDEPAIIVANHAQMNGPIACELYFPGNRYTWCAGQMMDRKTVPDYAYQDFWSGKPRYIRWFYRLLSYAIAPLAACIFTNAQTIGVYHDARILSTFKTTVKCLEEGASVVVFPEGPESGNNIVNAFQEKFADVAKLYYKRTGKAVQFVPMYIAPALKQMHIGKPIAYDPSRSMDEQRGQLCDQLRQSITDMARGLPRHRVVPYNNIPRKQYPQNITDEEISHETARS